MDTIQDEQPAPPIYRRIVDNITRDITLGVLPPGHQLPTVRELAARSGVSHGTVKHAYDTLALSGLIEKIQGCGTFVARGKESDPDSAKVQAMRAIDTLLDRMEELSFTPRDIRIFMDLKLREREDKVRDVRVAAVDCSPEALLVMTRQILDIPHTDVSEYLLEDVLNRPKGFDPPADLVVTTPTHYDALSEKMRRGEPPVRLVMAIATNTALDLAAVPPDTRLGILCASWRFGQVILRACDEYCALNEPVKAAYFGDGDSAAVISAACDRLILPPNYSHFASPVEMFLLENYGKSHPFIQYHYQIERGSLLYLEDRINKIYLGKK
ncbi:MAG: GntR family transcriptional regulator [Spirochaetaceae bacterium]|jgi:DNA-binding transcriptional regulator YhcF (GntR family)|nr:GntR family transcriptional regulator [Spirochaetaceae bacterium]